MELLKFIKKKITRKDFIKLCIAGLGSLAIGSIFFRYVSAKVKTSTARLSKNVKGDYDLVIAKGDDPYRITIEAIEAFGGMHKFVQKNDIVLIKPNMSWDRTPEQAANTNPLIVAALVELCLKAGAKRVNVFDNTCNDARRCYKNSGVAKAAREKGAKAYFADDWDIIRAKFNYSSPMEGRPIYRDALECDTFINVPILKHHGLTGLTLSMKNLMGVCAGGRSMMHNNIGRKLVDLADFIKPDLTIMDAYRVLLRNGPSGGNLDDVKLIKTVIVGTDFTLIDTYACKVVGRDPMSIPYIMEAVERGVGSHEVEKANIRRIEHRV